MLDRAIISFISIVLGLALGSANAEPQAPNIDIPVVIKNLPGQVSALALRLTALEKSESALKSEIEKLRSELNSAKAELDVAKKQASQAASQAGQTANWINQNGPSVLQAVAAFPTHTHAYAQAHIGWTNHSCKNGVSGPDTVPCSEVRSVTQMPAITDVPKPK